MAMENMKFKISIITINYNNEEGLKKTIKSVESQSYQDFEFIIIDGKSTDNSVELIEKCSCVAKWVSEEDTGVYNAMNKGVRMSQGEYLIFMNSGDVFYDNNVLALFLKELDTQEDIVYGNSIYYNDSGYYREEFPPKKLGFSFFVTAGINHQAVFIKRELFFKNFFYEESYKISADWDFFIRNICLNSASYKHVNSFVCRYDFSGISANPKNQSCYIEERDRTLNTYFAPFYDQIYKNIFLSVSRKRLYQFLYLKQFKTLWKLLRGFINILILFTPNKKYKKYLNQ